MNLKFSRFLETRKVDDDIIVVFHRLHPSFVYVKTQEWGLFKIGLKQPRELIKRLKEEYLIIQSDTEDDEQLKKVRKEYEKKLDSVVNLYLVLTYDCNLRCKYCFQFSRRTEETANMNLEVVRKGIDLWARHIVWKNKREAKYSIIFYGGEPLLNLSALQEGLVHIERLQKENKLPPKDRLKLIVITNGILLDENTARLFKDHSVEASISLDGPAEVHNVCRVDKIGKPTFEIVKRAISILKKSGVNVCVSVTVTPYNLRIIKNIPEFLIELDIMNMGLNRLVGKTILRLDNSTDLTEYAQQFAGESVMAFIEGKKRRICEERIQEKIDCFTKRKYYLLDCYGYGEQIVIQPNGYVSNCHASSAYDIRHIKECDDNFRIGDIPSVRNWRKRLPLYNPECLNCFAISICGGGCPWNAGNMTGNYFEIDKASCIYTKTVFEFLIKDGYKKK